MTYQPVANVVELEFAVRELAILTSLTASCSIEFAHVGLVPMWRPTLGMQKLVRGASAARRHEQCVETLPLLIQLITSVLSL